MADHFPDGVTLQKMEGTDISVESQDFRLTRLISEKVIKAFQVRTAVFEGQRLRDGAAAVLKLRYEIPPLLIVQSDRSAVLQSSINYFRRECRVVKQCEKSDHTPIYYGCAELRQDEHAIYPGGYLHVLAMSRVPGCSVVDIAHLTDNELSIIKAQLAKILEHMRLQGFLYSEAAPEQVFYDRDNEQTYLTGFAGMVVIRDRSKVQPITESSGSVLAFDLWGYPW